MAANDLATLAQVKEYLPHKGSEDDTLLSRLIEAASSFIENELSRTIKLATYTESYNGSGSKRQMLRQYPVVSVAAVSIDGVVIPASAYVNDVGYRHDSYSVFVTGYTFSRGCQNVAVTYNAGFAAVPADLVQCCCELVAVRFRERSHLDKSSEGLAGASTSYLRKEVTPFADAILKNYMRRIPL